MSSEFDGEGQQDDAYTNVWPALDNDIWDFDRLFDFDTTWNEPEPVDSVSDHLTSTHSDPPSRDPSVHHTLAPIGYSPSSNPHPPSQQQPQPRQPTRHIPPSNGGSGSERPQAVHSDNWPIQALAPPRRSSEDSHHWQTLFDEEPQPSPSTSPNARSTANTSPIDSLSEEEDMPPATRHRTRPRVAAARGSVVDLTADASSPRRSAAVPCDTDEDSDAVTAHHRPRNLKRAPEEAGHHGNAAGSKRRHRLSLAEIEQMDLTNEAPSIEDELRQANDDPTGPVKLGKRQCIICMEPYTNATVTACGHIYCHECLHQALRVGEKSDKAVGACPVCRKTVNRKKAGVAGSMVVVNFMKRSAFERKGRRL